MFLTTLALLSVANNQFHQKGEEEKGARYRTAADVDSDDRSAETPAKSREIR